MEEHSFEGSVILEKLAVIGKVDAFYEAIDADDLSKAAALMRKASVDPETIATALKMISEADDEH